MTKNQKQALRLIDEFLRTHQKLQEIMRQGQQLTLKMRPREFYGLQETPDFQRVLEIIEKIDNPYNNLMETDENNKV